jgi:CBS domain-containing protein
MKGHPLLSSLTILEREKGCPTFFSVGLRKHRFFSNIEEYLCKTVDKTEGLHYIGYITINKSNKKEVTMINVRDILNEKGNTIYSVKPDTTVYESLEKMSAHNVGSMLVMVNDKLQGIFTERDYMKKVALLGRSSKSTAAKEIMTANPICVAPADSAENALAIMTEEHCRHLPVIDEGKIVGVVSIGDLVKKKISAMEAAIKHLNDYISSAGYQ